MNELRPGMPRLLPGGSGGAGTAGAGKRIAARAVLTLSRVISSRPASAPAAAPASATPLATRNRRLPGHGDGSGSWGLGRKVKEEPGAGRSGGASRLVASPGVPSARAAGRGTASAAGRGPPGLRRLLHRRRGGGADQPAEGEGARGRAGQRGNDVGRRRRGPG